MSQNNNFACHERKKLSALHPTTSESTCKLTKNRHEDCKAWCRIALQFTLKECSS